MFAAHPYNHFCTEYPPGRTNHTDTLNLFLTGTMLYQVVSTYPFYTYPALLLTGKYTQKHIQNLSKKKCIFERNL